MGILCYNMTMEENGKFWQKLLRNKNFWVVIGAVIALVLAVIGALIFWNIQEDKRIDAEAISYRENLIVPFGANAKVSDFVIPNNGTKLEDAEINTEQLGQVEVTYSYVNTRNKHRTRTFVIEVVDKVAPTIYGSGVYTLSVGYQGDLTNLMLSGDDIDDNVRREVIGEYNLNKVGSYNLIYQVTDQSGNQATKDFILRITEPTNTATVPVEIPKLDFAKVIKDHKTSRTKIGIDVSQWQGEVDWRKVKKAGAEFAMIRVGYQKGFDGEYILDPYFERNIQNAVELGLPVGVYFYSYANSIEEAVRQAEWVYEQVQGYPLELGVAFDWESWGDFNEAGMSFYTINKVANTFLDTLAEFGYSGMLYGSKVYLERIWQPGLYPVWLAQYYTQVTYEGDFQMWQMSSSGRIDGIDGDVDIDILYLE